MEQAVQIRPQQIPAVFAVGVQHPRGGVVERCAIGGKAAAARLRGRGQRPQCGGQIALVEVQLAAQLLHHAPRHRLLPFGLGLDVLGH